MDEFFPKDYTDHESDVEDDFPVYTLSRHWKEELQLDKPETQAQRRARRVMRPARRATGVHIINPDPTHMNSADTRVYDTNLFLEIKLSWRPGGARVNFIKGEQVVFAVEFKDYNATSDKDRYDQPEPDLALVLHHLDSNKKLVQYEVDRKTFKPEELHTYSFNVRQRASSVKISVNETEVAKVSIFEQLTETQISSTEGLEVMALHQPCRLEKPFTTTIVPELGVGERIVLFGTFELTDCDHNPNVFKSYGLSLSIASKMRKTHVCASSSASRTTIGVSVQVLLPVTYYGKDKNKPLLMAFGTCIMGVGSLTMALPYFVGPQYSFSQPRPDTCELAAAVSNESGPACEPGAGDLRNYKWFFWVGNFINGIGTSPYFTLGIAYLDENFPRAVSAKYIAAFQASAIVGPATGFVVNGHFLKYYVDQGVNPALLGLTRDSTAWVGAWWLCFLYAGLLCFAVALPVSFLPAELPDRAIVMAEKKLEEQAKPADQHEENMRTTVMSLLGIKPFVLVCFAGSAELMVASGLSSFLVKMLQAQFSMTASTASMIMGSVTIPTAMVGVMLGGVVISRYELGARGIVRMCALVLLAPITLVTVLLFHCGNIPYRNVQYDTSLTSVSSVNVSLTEACNSRCGCTTTRFNPICGRDGYTYYSPCFAGCLREYATADSRAYSQCLCVNHTAGGSGATAAAGSSSVSPFGTVPGTMVEIEAVRNKCPNPCGLVNVFIPILAAIVFATFFLSTPAVAATLRCIPEQHKSVGLGIQWTIVRAFGLIPAGAAFGHTIDASCVLWEEPCGSSQGACAIYDNRLLNRNVYFLILALKSASLCCFGLALFFLREPRPPPVSVAALPD
ncbi:hypothetical protein V5799_033439 [Amblyomma americanum]|uniref:Solute carrier organic anion transporter family member n=1 Tax=Amblyomma americanum TaxID=6943 RepID=A0AAQ4DNB0_AMBAM